MAPTNPYCIALQPICDNELKHVADKLLYRSSSAAYSVTIDNPLLATVRSCASAIYEVGISNLVGERMLLFTAPLQWIEQPDILDLPSKQLIAELPLALFDRPDPAAAAHRLRQRGYHIAVDATALQRCPELTADAVDIIKIDVRQADAWRDHQRFKTEHNRLMATFVEDRTHLDQARSAGFDWYQGFVFSPPIHIRETGRKRSGNRAVELQLLAELASQDMDIDRLESLLAQHPHCCILLLQQANSAAFRRNARINTLREALVLLGSQRVKSIVSTLLLADNDPVREVQIRPLLNRAALAMHIAERIRSLDSRVAFTLGLFSRLDAIEELPMDKLLEELPFSLEIKNALLHRDGEMGKLLSLLDAYEAGHVEHLSSSVITMLNDDFLRAAAWTEQWIVTV
jgi:EAL and modified HD-GYP domain-containing signal transduction protein